MWEGVFFRKFPRQRNSPDPFKCNNKGYRKTTPIPSLFSITTAWMTILRTLCSWATLPLSGFNWKMERQSIWIREYLWKQKSMIFTAWPTKHGTRYFSYIFSRWNIVFFPLVIVATIVFAIGDFVWDISEIFFWWSTEVGLMCYSFRWRYYWFWIRSYEIT